MTSSWKLLFCCSLVALGVPRIWAQSSYNEAVGKARAGDWETACGMAAGLVRRDPASYASHNLMGLCAVRKGDHAAAERAFRKSIALNPKFPDSRNNLALELLRRGERAEAILQFKASLRTHPNNLTANYNLGRIELDAGNHGAAMPHLTAAAVLAPGDLSVRLALAEGLALSGQETRAREALKEPFQQQPELAEKLLSLARAASSHGRYANAGAILAGFDPPPQYAAEWHAISGYADYKMGNPKRAEERLRRALELDPSVEEYWMNMAELLLFHRSFEAAVAFLERGLAELPESAGLHLGIGISQLSAGGKDEEAIRRLETALQLRPDYEPALSALCGAHYRKKQWRQLQETAARWLRVNPKAFGAYYYQAMTALENHQDTSLTEAQRLLQKSIELQPRFAASRLALGKLLVQRDQPARALLEFKAAIEADPGEPAAHYQLGVTYRKLGQLAHSRQALERFKSMKSQQQPWNFVFQLVKDPR